MGDRWSLISDAFKKVGESIVPDISTIMLSAGTTLAIPSAYFALFKYPQSFGEKVGAMSMFSQVHLAEIEDTNYITGDTKGAADVLSRAFEIYSKQKPDVQTSTALEDEIQVELAKLRGFRDSNELTDGFVTVSEEMLRNLVDRMQNGNAEKDHGRSIQIDVRAVMSSMQIQQRKVAIKRKLYFADMHTQQASIDGLNHTLQIAMVGLQVYLAAIAIWVGYLAHVHGLMWRFSAPVSVGVYLSVALLLRYLADKSVAAPRLLLSRLKDLNA